MQDGDACQDDAADQHTTGDEVRRHLHGRPRTHPPRRAYRRRRGQGRPNRSPSSSRPWPARPTNWWPGPTARAAPRAGLPLSDDEYDVVVASGEQVTSGLLALTLRNMGLNARSWMGWQIPIMTDEAHGPRPHRRCAGREAGRRARRRRDRRRPRLPGRQPLGPDHHPGPRRIGHLGGRRGRGPGLRLRHLYRRGRRLHDRPAHREPSPAAGKGLLRGDAGDGVAGRQGAPDPLGRTGHGRCRCRCACCPASSNPTKTALCRPSPAP